MDFGWRPIVFESEPVLCKSGAARPRNDFELATARPFFLAEVMNIPRHEIDFFGSAAGISICLRRAIWSWLVPHKMGDELKSVHERLSPFETAHVFKELRSKRRWARRL